MRVRIGIVTHNRADLLVRAIESALEQDYPDKEVLIVDDGSTDGTKELIAKYPQVRWLRNETVLGYREARNRMMTEAGADLFCSLDDDSWFLTTDGLAQGVKQFLRTPRLGALGFEILDQGNTERSGCGPARPMNTFIGCGHLLRLEAVKEAGYYVEVPGAYGGEEKDLSIRLLNLGWDVIQLSGVQVWHDKTMTARNVASQHTSGVSNDLAFAMNRCPALVVFGVLLGKTFSHFLFTLRFAFKKPSNLDSFDTAIRQQIGAFGFIRPFLRGVGRFLKQFPRLLKSRKTVKRPVWMDFLNRSRSFQPPYPTESPDRVTISITTRNRCEVLKNTLKELERLDPPADEILVCIDGGHDDTAALIRKEFPKIRVLEEAKWKGSIPCRDRILREATGEIVFSLDDDSYPLHTDSIQIIKNLFRQHPEVAVFTFPQISDEFPHSYTQILPSTGSEITTGSFTDSGAAIRRSIYQRLPGYLAFFQHAYEEPDFALQCVAAGYEVRLTSSLAVRHHYSRLERNEMRTHGFHSRNELWSVLIRCPWLLLPLVAPYRMIRQFFYAIGRGLSWVIREPLWWWEAFCRIPRCLTHRRAVRMRCYWKWLHLLRSVQK